MLKQSQKRTKRAPLIEASMSRTPARNAGWLATMPTGRAVQARESDDDVLGVVLLDFEEVAVVDDGVDDILDVVGLVGFVGNDGVELRRRRGRWDRCRASRGGSSRLLEGRKLSSSRTIARHSASSCAMKCATPEVSLCVTAPPSSSLVTSSWVTVLITSGPVMNM